MQTHGDIPNYLRRQTQVYTVKSDFSTRRWKQHTWKTGFEFKNPLAQRSCSCGESFTI